MSSRICLRPAFGMSRRAASNLSGSKNQAAMNFLCMPCRGVLPRTSRLLPSRLLLILGQPDSAPDSVELGLLCQDVMDMNPDTDGFCRCTPQADFEDFLQSISAPVRDST